MKIDVWCRSARLPVMAATPAQIEENPKLDAWQVGEFEVQTCPRQGEWIVLHDGWSSQQVEEVHHNVYDGTATIEIPWIDPDEWAARDDED